MATAPISREGSICKQRRECSMDPAIQLDGRYLCFTATTATGLDLQFSAGLDANIDFDGTLIFISIPEYSINIGAIHDTTHRSRSDQRKRRGNFVKVGPMPFAVTTTTDKRPRWHRRKTSMSHNKPAESNLGGEDVSTLAISLCLHAHEMQFSVARKRKPRKKTHLPTASLPASIQQKRPTYNPSPKKSYPNAP